MSIQKEILLRHRSPGYVRFQLPTPLCEATVAGRLTHALLQLNGVYRVHIYRRQHKLAIRYVEEVCSFLMLAKQLSVVVNELETHLIRPAAVQTKSSRIGDRISASKAGLWAKSKYQESKETVQALGILGKLGIKKNAAILKDPEKAVIDFFNDVLVLYLIKTHWPLITQQWLAKPFRHRYEWLSVFYMMYLLMRSRMPKKK